MGTNFYLKGYPADDDMDPQYHIGKRSSAGLYCWDCGLTLCKEGSDGVHTHSSEWSEYCIKCGKFPEPEDLSQSSAGRELGFNKQLPSKKVGVKSCSSFSWAMHPDNLFHGSNLEVVDEYGREYSIDEFHKVLDECPLQSFDSIGRWFC